MAMIGSIVIVLPAQASRIKQSTEIEGPPGFGGFGGFGGGGMPGGMFGGGGQPGPSGGGFPDMSGMLGGGGKQGPLAKMSAEDKDATRPQVDPITPECFKATVQSRTSMIPIIMPGKMYYNSPAKSLRIEDPGHPAAAYEIQRYDLQCTVKAQPGEKLNVTKLMDQMSGFQLPPRELTTYEGTEVVGDVKCHRYTFKLGVPNVAEIQFTSWIRVQAPHVPVYLIADTKAGLSLSLHQYFQDHTIGCDFAPNIFDAPECSSDGGRPPKALVFSEHAGEGAIAGEADKFGNVKGDIGDLVRDGTFKGQTVVVLKLIHETACTFNEAKAALEKKGLTVKVYDAGNLPDATALDKMLQDANQCWVISDDTTILNDKHFEALVKHWNNGMGMYVLGDNLPFFVDANKLLAKFGLPQLQGNRPGGKVLKESTSAKGPGFIRHPLTTGLVSLFEGETVSTLPETAVTDAGMVAIMREDSYKEIVVAYLEAKGGNGGLVVDGGFTKLYPQNWATTSGSARLVVNIAALLAVK